MKLNPKDEYVLLADMIDWAAVEAEYRGLFKSGRGRPAASARMALGSLSIQKRANPGDCKLVTEIVRGKVKDPVEFGAKYDVSVALSVLVADLFGVRLPRLFFVLFHGRARRCVGVSSAGNRGRGGMTGSVAGIRRRRTVAGRRETPHLPPDRGFYGQTLG